MPDKSVRDPLTVGEAFDVMIDSSDSVRRSADYLRKVVRVLARVAVPITVSLALVSTALIFQIELRNDKIARLEKTQVELKIQLTDTKNAANEAKDAAGKAQVAAESADTALKTAIANSQQQSNDSNSAINKIDKIYDAICVKRGEC